MAQPLNENWLIYVPCNRTRAALIMSGININGVNVQETSARRGEEGGGGRTECVLLKDLPETIPTERIMTSLHAYTQIVTHNPLNMVIVLPIFRYVNHMMQTVPWSHGEQIIILSPFTMEYGDCVFKSSEHFYQHEFYMYMERYNIAQQVLDAASPRKAKQVAAPVKVTRAIYKVSGQIPPGQIPPGHIPTTQ